MHSLIDDNRELKVEERELSGDDNHPLPEPILLRVLRLHFQRVAKEKEVNRDNSSS